MQILRIPGSDTLAVGVAGGTGGHRGAIRREPGPPHDGQPLAVTTRFHKTVAESCACSRFHSEPKSTRTALSKEFRGQGEDREREAVREIEPIQVKAGDEVGNAAAPGGIGRCERAHHPPEGPHYFVKRLEK